MKHTIFILFFISLITSCVKEDIEPNPPLPPQPIVTDTTSIDSVYTLSGQDWVLTGYRVGEFGDVITLNDTIYFLDDDTYLMNGYESTYHLTETMSGMNLSLYSFIWGDMSGSINMSMFNYGSIPGVPFNIITPGTSNSTNYYLWITKI
jgi:hypothetical protein